MTSSAAAPRGHTDKWRKSDRVPERAAIRIINSDGMLVAEARAAGGSWAAAKKHARLIAAAPVMLDALYAAEDAMTVPGINAAIALQVIRAAIKLATGAP